MSIFQKIILAVTIIGGLNMGIIGIFDFNIISFIFQDNTIAIRIVYTVIGLCALVSIGTLMMVRTTEVEAPRTRIVPHN